MRLFVALIAATAIGPLSAVAQTACRLDWTLEEALRLGSLTGEDALSYFGSVAVGSDGEIYVPQMSLGSVLVFSSDGRLVRELGRKGSGPGEFEDGPRVVSWIDGELWVADRFRAQSFGPDGTPRAFVSFQTWVGEEGSAFRPEVPLADGHYWARRTVSTIRGGAQPASLAIRRWDEDGAMIDTIAILDVRDQRVVLSPETGGFARHPLWGMLPGGGPGELSQVLAADRASVVLIGEVREDEGSFDLLRITTVGDTVLKRSLPYVPREISRNEREWWFDQFAAVMAGDSSQTRAGYLRASEATRNRERAAAREAFWLPEHYPPVRRILAGEDGTIWLLREPNVLEPKDRWEVYDQEGELIGRITDSLGRARFTPWLPRLDVLQASSEALWVSTMDDFDVPYLHRYRIDRGCSN